MASPPSSKLPNKKFKQFRPNKKATKFLKKKSGKFTSVKKFKKPKPLKISSPKRSTGIIVSKGKANLTRKASSGIKKSLTSSVSRNSSLNKR